MSTSKESSGHPESPLTASVTAKLAAMIRSGRLPADELLPSERELTTILAASRGVIRAAIRDLTNEGLLEVKPRCRPVVRCRLCRKVTGGERSHIGIWLWPNTADYGAASILRGIQSRSLSDKVRLVIASAVGGDWKTIYEAEAHFFENLQSDPEQAGAIVWYLGGRHNLEHLRILRRANVPIVFVDRLPPPGFPGDFVGTDNENAARNGVQSLINLGHRKIAMITNIDAVSSTQSRETGYRRAMKAAGLPIPKDYVFRDEVDGPEGVDAAINLYLQMKDPPTAIFCVNDHVAIQVYDALQSRNIAVPDQISVLGFDGILRWLPGGGNLTTMAQDFERMGQIAADLVIERMSSGVPDAFRHVLLDAPLVTKGSTGPAPKTSSLFINHPHSLRRTI